MSLLYVISQTLYMTGRWCGWHWLHFEKDGKVMTEINSKVRGSHDKMRCGFKFNRLSPSQNVNNDQSLVMYESMCVRINVHVNTSSQRLYFVLERSGGFRFF